MAGSYCFCRKKYPAQEAPIISYLLTCSRELTIKRQLFAPMGTSCSGIINGSYIVYVVLHTMHMCVDRNTCSARSVSPFPHESFTYTLLPLSPLTFTDNVNFWIFSVKSTHSKTRMPRRKKEDELPEDQRGPPRGATLNHNWEFQ